MLDSAGIALGSWSAPELRQPTGIATSGSDIWIVDKGTDRVYYYQNATSWTTGQRQATSSFPLLSGNATPEGIAADGQTVWVVDGDTPDRVYVYVAATGLSDGYWGIDSGNTSPTGIAIDPYDTTNTIWIVDISRGRVYEYAGARKLHSGAMSATDSFPLTSANAGPHDIAVRGLNPSLLLSSIGAQSVAAKTELSFAVRATDTSHPTGTLTYSAEGLPAGAAFDPATQTFRWRPAMSQAPGTYVVTFSVSDGAALASEDVAISVLDPCPWQNHTDPPDADGNGHVSPLDALLIINRINLFGNGLLPSRQADDPYLDVSGDNQVGPDDTLAVVNYLNAAAEGEGESEPVMAGGASRTAGLTPLSGMAARVLQPQVVSAGGQADQAASPWLWRNATDIASSASQPKPTSDAAQEELLTVLVGSRARTDWQAAADELLSQPAWLLEFAENSGIAGAGIK